ncbi:hypothetical protein [uncultured Alistipes sp.]|uniref:hypothetical protein n=1 Tax=uncultured Alistipes sp. TaxID=538949 RepID=UPI0026E0A1E4|nr:hypothetical protein [uncultured Alistipes sp.]
MKTTPDAATTMPGAVKTMPDTVTTSPDAETTTPDTETTTPDAVKTTPDAATTMPGAVKTMPDTVTTSPDAETTTPDTETTTPGRNGPNGRTGPNRGKKSPFRAKKEKRWPPMKIFRPRSAERVDLFSYFCKGRFPAKLRSDASPPQFCLTLNKNQLLNLWNTPII